MVQQHSRIPESRNKFFQIYTKFGLQDNKLLKGNKVIPQESKVIKFAVKKHNFKSK